MDEGPSYRSIATIRQEAALWAAGLFLTLGFFGLLPGAMKKIDALSQWSTAPDAQLFGLFEVSLLHNFAHLILGAAALVASGTDRWARRFLAGAGIAMMILVVYGQVGTSPPVGGLVPEAPADAWLHGILGIAMFAAATSRWPSRN